MDMMKSICYGLHDEIHLWPCVKKKFVIDHYTWVPKRYSKLSEYRRIKFNKS
jgi:hypothetical protein